MKKNPVALPLYLAAEATSLFGNSAIAIVLPWLVLARTNDPSVAALVAGVSGIPSVIAALVGGHLIDLVGRRRMSVLSDIGSAVAVAALAVVDQLTGLTVGWFIALGVLGALFDVPGMTARETLMADVSASSGTPLDKVAGFRQAVFSLSFLAGPAVAGLLLAVLEPIQVVWLTAGCSALAALITAVLPLVSGGAPQVPDNDPLGGWRFVRRSRPLTAMLVIGFGSTLLVAPLLATILPAHFRSLDAPTLLGLTLSAYAVGSVLGSVAYAVVVRRGRWFTWVLSTVVYTVGFAVLGALAGFWLVAAGMLLAGIAGGLIGPVMMVAMTERVPDRLRGRVFGLYSALALVASPIGLVAMAAILQHGSLRVGAIAIAVAWLPVAVYSLAGPGLREFVGGVDDPAGSPEPEGITQEVDVADDRPGG